MTVRVVLYAVKTLAIAAAFLLSLYALSAQLLRFVAWSDGYRFIAIIGLVVLLALGLALAHRTLGLKILPASAVTCCWQLLFGCLTLLAILSVTVLYGSLVNVTIVSSAPDMMGGGVAVAFGASVAAVGAVSEEIAFRGVIQTWLRKRSAVFAIVVTSMLFCAWHVSNPLFAKLFAYYFLVGVALGMVYSLAGALLVPIALHFMLNTFVTVIAWHLQPFPLKQLLDEPRSLVAIASVAIVTAALAPWALRKASPVLSAHTADTTSEN